MAVLTLPAISPSMGSGLREKTRLLRVRLGDGYEQVATDGLNHIEVTYEAKWQNMPLSELDTLVAFFRARKGVEAFLFTVPGESTPRRFRCEDWQGPVRVSAEIGNLSAKFIQDFGL